MYRKIFIFILLFAVFHGEAQKKKSTVKTQQKKKSTRVIRFAPPIVVDDRDDFKKAITEGHNSFFWQMEGDTSVGADVLLREEIEIGKDSVFFKRYYSKNSFTVSKRNYFFYEDRDNKYYIETKAYSYKLNDEIISVLNPATKKYENYEYTPDDLFSANLVNLKTRKQYKDMNDLPNSGTEEILSYPR